MTLLSDPAEADALRLLSESIWTFGGPLSTCRLWIFAPEALWPAANDLAGRGIEALPLTVPAAAGVYPFGAKVAACARAEELAAPLAGTLTWLDAECLLVRPPELYVLDEGCDAALRPVHLRNVGLPPEAPLDAFWRGIYAAVGLADAPFTVRTFLDDQPLRAYFNSHGFSINPRLGLLRKWENLFTALLADADFQASACADDLHRIFLFQALWSALLTAELPRERLRLLPPDYNYPYNLHGRVASERRAVALNELTSLTYEGRSLAPELVQDVEIREPLRSWLAARVPPAKTER